MEWQSAGKIASAFKIIIRIYIGECENSSNPLYVDKLLRLNLKNENSPPHRIIYFLVRTVVIRKSDFLIKKEKRKNGRR